MIHACIRLVPRATRSSVIVDSCERAALSVSILLGSLKTFPAKLFEKLQSFASNVCNELWSTKAHRASLSQEFAKESTIALESVARDNSLTRGWQARHSRAFLSATRVVSPHFPNTGITEKQLRSKVLHQSPNVLYDSREGIEMGEHVPCTSPTMPSDHFLRLIKVTLSLEFIPWKKSLRNYLFLLVLRAAYTCLKESLFPQEAYTETRS